MAGHPRFKQLTEAEQKLHDEKNEDYAKGGRPLGNFERVSKILGLYPNLKLSDPTVVALTYAMKQLDAALWMLNGEYEGKVENITTRLGDVSIYMKLAIICHEEQRAETFLSNYPRDASLITSSNTPVDYGMKAFPRIRYAGGVDKAGSGCGIM